MASNRGVNLSEFISKLGEAGFAASRACEEYAKSRLEALCVEVVEGQEKRLVPKTVNMEVGGKQVEVPLIALMPPTHILPEYLKINFETTVYLGEDGEANLTGHKGVLKRGVDLKTEVMFRSGDGLEAIELIREHVNKDVAAALAH